MEISICITTLDELNLMFNILKKKGYVWGSGNDLIAYHRTENIKNILKSGSSHGIGIYTSEMVVRSGVIEGDEKPFEEFIKIVNNL